ncbi:hypothetical protein GTR02_13050 [Kineococcus sp. R8]|uniref:hypothetical protein n=1 Tax=Kineococcus siccus TaxID=2696567 RepID=UPI001412A591|nr:hypothetical protein [Kineococcus siccus]NAZ82749.1 hypothetical protein [Kineococcus siccus]
MTHHRREGDVGRPPVKPSPGRDDTLGMEAIEGPVGRAGGAGVVDDVVTGDVLVELHELPLPALRRRHDLLEAELRRVRYWQRLLRARRDLLVAGTVAPDELAVPLEAAAHDGPLEQHLGAVVGDAFAVTAPGGGLRTLVLPVVPRAEAPSQLADLQGAEHRLSVYATALAAERALTAQVLAERCGLLFGAGPAAPTS